MVIEKGSAVEGASALMLSFAERTGLMSSTRPGRRYLWTDAFAVCSFLALARATGEARYSELALRLVDLVHHTLGRHRPDDRRRGWISGLDEGEGESHPTRGGLRIGKELPERAPGEPFDDSLEWDRDGQYFHYLTKWMHSLDQASRLAGRPELNLWARELAQVAHAAFSYDAPGPGRRMYWKMSIDLKRPLVRSMGQHDALDGHVTCLQLEATASVVAPDTSPDLRAERSDFAAMLLGQSLATDDPLGLGGLLADAWRVEQLRRGAPLADALLESALAGLERYARLGELEGDAEQRLAFRELGLAIGLHAVASLRAAGEAGRSSQASARRRSLLDSLRRHDRFRAEIETFWLAPANRAAASWLEHRDINEVMLATCVLPEGYLRLDGLQ